MPPIELINAGKTIMTEFTFLCTQGKQAVLDVAPDDFGAEDVLCLVELAGDGLRWGGVEIIVVVPGHNRGRAGGPATSSSLWLIHRATGSRN